MDLADCFGVITILYRANPQPEQIKTRDLFLPVIFAANVKAKNMTEKNVI